MENKLENLEKFITDEMRINGEYKIINFKGVYLCVFKNGEVYRFNDKFKNPKFKIVPNIGNSGKGYNQIGINGKMTFRHRIICHIYKNLNIDNEKRFVDHINGDILDNSIDNLRIVNNQQNCLNQTKAKGYSWHKGHNKWHSRIKLNGKLHNLGYYTTEEDARSAYLAAKLIYHKIEVQHIEQELNYEDLEREFEAIVCN